MCLTYESALSTLAPFVTQFCSTKQLLQSYVTTPLKNKSSNQKNFSFKFSEFKRSLRLVIKMLITLPKCQLPLNGLQLELVRFWNTRLPKRLNKDTNVSMYLQCKIIAFREAAFIANTLMSARIFFRCCQHLVAATQLILLTCCIHRWGEDFASLFGATINICH